EGYFGPHLQVGGRPTVWCSHRPISNRSRRVLSGWVYRIGNGWRGSAQKGGYRRPQILRPHTPERTVASTVAWNPGMTPPHRPPKFRRITPGSRKSLASGLARLAWSSNERRRSCASLALGPLSHLPSEADRVASLREAFRVLASGGMVVAAAISRYASALDGLGRKLSLDPRFVKIRDRDLADGQHRNDTDNMDYFTTAYFHRPDDLRSELEVAGFRNVRVLGVEGPGWILQDFDIRWEDARMRKDLLDVGRAFEAESSVVGVSAHLLAIGWKQ